MWKTSGGFSSSRFRSRWMYAYETCMDPLVLERVYIRHTRHRKAEMYAPTYHPTLPKHLTDTVVFSPGSTRAVCPPSQTNTGLWMRSYSVS